MTRIASLGMYDAPAIASANDALWRGIAAVLRAGGLDDVPDALDRARPLDAIWSDPALLLAQTCGYPFATRWRGRLRYVATPRYTASGCEGATHRSLFVVRADDPARALEDARGGIAAVNDRASNSGANLFRAAIAPWAGAAPVFADVIETGSHLASATAVADGTADIAAIDCVTWTHVGRHAHDVARRLRVLGLSALSPALPLVTAADASDDQVALLRRALAHAIAAPATRWAADLLLIDGFEILPPDAYDAVLAYEARAVEAGYPALA
jgi:ABC-type phosphate/phosphonate transport system substrate-binding protein